MRKEYILVGIKISRYFPRSNLHFLKLLKRSLVLKS
jgi:hypothetical protein